MILSWASQVVLVVKKKKKKKKPANVGDIRDVGSIPGFGRFPWKIPLEEGMATHSSIFAWRIPWTEKSDRL